MVKIDSIDLKPCPLCGEPVNAHKKPSSDGTIIFVEITHGPQTPCGILFIDYEDNAAVKWNKRIKD